MEVKKERLLGIDNVTVGARQEEQRSFHVHREIAAVLVHPWSGVSQKGHH